MAKAQDNRTPKEKEEVAINLLCQSITTSAAYSGLKARIYERMEGGAVSGAYDSADRAAIDLGAYKAASILFKVLEENTITPPKPKPNSDEY